MKTPKSIFTSLATLLLVGALSAGSLFLTTEEGARLSLVQLTREARRTECLNRDLAALDRGMEARQTVITELIEGRLSLRAAATALRAEYLSRPSTLHTSAANLPDKSTLAFHVRSACEWAEYRLTNSPRREEVLQRLQAELRRDFPHLAGATMP